MLTIVRYAVITDATSLEVVAQSTLHPLKGTSRKLTGTFAAAWNADGTLALDPAPQLHLEVPVASLSSGNVLLDQQLRGTIGSRVYPMVVADLVSLQATDKPGQYVVTGRIDVRGTQSDVSGTLTARLDGESALLDGSCVVDMRAFGIAPPRLLMLEVQPEIAVRLRMEAAPV